MGRKYQPEEVVFLYALKDPRDGVINYIGISHDTEQRLKEHCWVPRDAAYWSSKEAWVYALSLEGFLPELEILKEVKFDEAGRVEHDTIMYYAALGRPLKNRQVNFDAYIQPWKPADCVQKLIDRMGNRVHIFDAQSFQPRKYESKQKEETGE